MKKQLLLATLVAGALSSAHLTSAETAQQELERRRTELSKTTRPLAVKALKERIAALERELNITRGKAAGELPPPPPVDTEKGETDKDSGTLPPPPPPVDTEKGDTEKDSGTLPPPLPAKSDEELAGDKDKGTLPPPPPAGSDEEWTRIKQAERAASAIQKAFRKFKQDRTLTEDAKAIIKDNAHDLQDYLLLAENALSELRKGKVVEATKENYSDSSFTDLQSQFGLERQKKNAALRALNPEQQKQVRYYRDAAEKALKEYITTAATDDVLSKLAVKNSTTHKIIVQFKKDITKLDLSLSAATPNDEERNKEIFATLQPIAAKLVELNENIRKETGQPGRALVTQAGRWFLSTVTGGRVATQAQLVTANVDVQRNVDEIKALFAKAAALNEKFATALKNPVTKIADKASLLAAQITLDVAATALAANTRSLLTANGFEKANVVKLYGE